VSKNSHASLGRREAVGRNFWKQLDGYDAHCLAFGIAQGDRTVTVETWIPTDKAGIWASVLERIRGSVQFTD
jgi:hypothetical protein